MSQIDARQVAAQLFNRCWDLLESAPSTARDLELVEAAMTSRYLWRQVGGVREWAVADWMASRALVGAGAFDLAVSYAESALAQTAGFPLWLQASLLEGCARANRAAGHEDVARDQIAQAQKFLSDEPDRDDAALILEQLSDLL